MTGATASFDLMVIGRRKLATAGTGIGPPTRATLNKMRVRVVQQVFNDRRLLYRNRVQANRGRLVLSTIETNHHREQIHQRLQRYQILNDLKLKENSFKTTSENIFMYPKRIDLTEPKDFYRFGVRVQSANPRVPVDVTSTATSQLRSRSASILRRPFTAPVISTEFHSSIESDDLPSDLDQTTKISERTSIENFEENHDETTETGFTTHRITWPVKLKVFALADEDETRQEFLAWQAEQRQNLSQNASNDILDPKEDLELQRKYEKSIRKQQEIDAFITEDLIHEHQINDPIFAKRYRQLQIAVRTGKVPNYDPHDRNLNPRITKSSIQRTQSALMSAQAAHTKYLRERQKFIQNAQLSQRISLFLQRFDQFKENQRRDEK